MLDFFSSQNSSSWSGWNNLYQQGMPFARVFGSLLCSTTNYKAFFVVIKEWCTNIGWRPQQVHLTFLWWWSGVLCSFAINAIFLSERLELWGGTSRVNVYGAIYTIFWSSLIVVTSGICIEFPLLSLTTCWWPIWYVLSNWGAFLAEKHKGRLLCMMLSQIPKF
jgi:hypothetical protein